MTGRRLGLTLAVVLSVALLPLGVVWAQETQPPEQTPPESLPEQPEAEVPANEAPAQEAPAEEAPDSDLIGDLLAASEDSFEAVAEAVYDSGNRRDPFRSLMRVTEPTRIGGPRPEGIPGLLVNELSLEGVWLTREGPVAQVLSSDNPVSYLLHEGDRLFDGEVLHIRYERGVGGEVVFRQENDDPNAPKPFKETTLRLAQ